MFRHLEHDAIQLLGILLAALVIGQFSGRTFLSLLVGLLLFLAFHFYRLLQLHATLGNDQRLKAPFPPGLWGDIYADVRDLQIQSRKRKRNLVRFASRFREAAHALPDAVVLLNKARYIEWVNPAAKTLLGIRWPAHKGHHIAQLLQQPALLDSIHAADYSEPVEFSPPHDPARILSVQVTPFGKKKRQRLLVARDITRLHHLEQVRRDFVANVSHELRTPLTVVIGFLENLIGLDETTPIGQARRPLELMEEQMQRMTSVIDDLLTLSRLENDSLEAGMRAVDAPALLRAIVADARNISDGAYSFETEIEPNLWVEGVESELRSAFSNLVFNAVKHTPPGTRIRILWHLSDGAPVLVVEDDGPGIPQEHITRITERFYRVDTARSRESGGTGLGLAIVKHVLHRHRAELLISSKVGEGTRFTCRFPATACVAAGNHQARSSTGEGGGDDDIVSS